LPSQAQLNNPRIHLFTELDQALSWADAAVALRVQKERHFGEKLNINDYIQRYSLNHSSIRTLKSNALIMHPGPINYGVELEKEILTDSRAVILQLVQNGTFLREALIRHVLNEGVFK